MAAVPPSVVEYNFHYIFHPEETSDKALSRLQINPPSIIQEITWHDIEVQEEK